MTHSEAHLIWKEISAKPVFGRALCLLKPKKEFPLLLVRGLEFRLFKNEIGVDFRNQVPLPIVEFRFTL